MVKFCNYVNQGWEPRRRDLGRFFFRKGDQERPTGGKPDIPAKWIPCLLRNHVEGQVVRVNEDGSGVIDIGSRKGLYPGMWLETRSLEAEYSWLVVISVEEDRARVRAEMTWERFPPKIVAGTKVFTKISSPEKSRYFEASWLDPNEPSELENNSGE